MLTTKPLTNINTNTLETLQNCFRQNLKEGECYIYAYGECLEKEDFEVLNLAIKKFDSKVEENVLSELKLALESCDLKFKIELVKFSSSDVAMVQDSGKCVRLLWDWEKLNLSKIINIIGGGTPKKSNKEYWNGNIPWLSVVDFNNDKKYVDETREKITNLGLLKSSTNILKKGQIIISARGTVGCLAQLKKEMAFNQSCYGIDSIELYTFNDYLYYLLKVKVSDFKNNAHGAVFDTITRETFKTIDTNLPPLPEQKRIARILSSLDDQIELNQKMNQTLESMAEAIFKSWFIDFEPVHAKKQIIETGGTEEEASLAAMEVISTKTKKELILFKSSNPKEYNELYETASLFPNSFVEHEEMGMIPEGWEVKKLGEVYEITLGGTPSRKKTEYWKGTIGWCNSGEINKKYIFEHSEYITELGLKKSSTKIVSKNSFLIAITGATLGQVSFSFIDSCYNQSVVSLSKNCKKYNYFGYLLIRSNIDSLKKHKCGGAQQHINKSIIFENKQLFPSKELLNSFDLISKNSVFVLSKNLFTAKNLKKTKNIFLETLIKGNY